MTVYSAVKSFVAEKFWAPASGTAEAYNVFNTSAYAVLFAVAAAYLGQPFLRKLELKMDRKFFMGITPFIILGGAVRILEDLGISETFLLVTPFIYLVIFGFTAISLVLSLKMERLTGYSYHLVLGSIGIGALTVPGIFISGSVTIVRPLALPEALLLFGTVSGSGYLALREFYPSLIDPLFMIPIASHYWDASTSFTALRNGATEKHVLADFFVQNFGPGGMFLMKTVIIVPAVYYICGSGIDQWEKKYYLFLVALLGLALGTRNILSITFG